MSDKRDRDPFDSRYAKSGETEESAKSAETEESTERSEGSKTSKSEESEESGGVRERKNVNMYLPDDVVDDMQLRYKQLSVEWQREHGEDLPKNAEYYPAVIRAALNGTTVKDELDLSED